MPKEHQPLPCRAIPRLSAPGARTEPGVKASLQRGARLDHPDEALKIGEETHGGPVLMVNARSNRAAVALPAPSGLFDDGEALIGRVLDFEQVRAVRSAFGLAGGPAMTGSEAFEAVMGRGAALALANGWRLARRRIMGADRVEIEGPVDTDTAVLKRMGCTVEIISWRTRIFAPGPDLLERVIERWPLAA